MKKGFPAFTLNLCEKDTNDESSLDVDLVPCFQFADDQWPKQSGGYRQNPIVAKNKFLIVPKKPKGDGIENSPTLERYWRLSFQEQERELISGHNLKVLKPTLRLLKKLRDRLDHAVIASYYIKTLFLWTVKEKEQDDSFWSQSLSCIFMTMLKRYEKHISDQEIPYFWNDQYNMVGHQKNKNSVILYNIGQRLKKVIEDIENHLDEPNIDPFVVGKYLLSREAFEKLKEEVNVSKKLERSRSVNANNNFSASICVKTTNGDTVDSLSSINSTNNVPPLLKLGFSLDDVHQIKDYIDYVQEEQTKKMNQIFDSHFVKINKTNENNAQKELMNCLTKIDAKIDKLTEKVDDFEKNNKCQVALMAQFEKRINNLEDQVNDLQLENKKLKENKVFPQLNQLPFLHQSDSWTDNLGKPH